MTLPIKVFIVYSHEDAAYKNEISKSLSLMQTQGLIDAWHDGQILPGNRWEEEIKQHIKNADLILTLISLDYYNSDYIQQKEMAYVFERHSREQCMLVPIIVRPCDWKNDAKIAKIQVLPEGGKAISEWKNKDKAYEHISHKLRFCIRNMPVRKTKTIPTYSSPLVLNLASRVIEKFKSEYYRKNGKYFPDVFSDERLFGFGNYSPATDKISHTIAKYILEDNNTRELIRQMNYEQYTRDHEGLYADSEVYDEKYLFQKRLEAEKDKNMEIEFSDRFMRIFLVFLGLSDVEELKANSEIYYVGFYLSFLSFVIRNFILTISNYADSDGKRWTTLKGFHARENAIDSEEYVGDTVISTDGWLYINLIGIHYGRRINLMGAINPTSRKSLSASYIKASIQAVTTADRLFCAETLLYRLKDDKIDDSLSGSGDFYGPVKVSSAIIPDREMAIISLYLVLHRNTFAFSNERIVEIEHLMARGNTVSEFIRIKGSYVIWNFNAPQTKVVESIFKINPDGTAFLQPYFSDRFYQKVAESEDTPAEKIREKLKNQPALINISRIHGIRKLVVITFGKPGLSVVNVAMFDFPDRTTKVLEGEFITLGDDKKIRSNSVVMYKLKDSEQAFPNEYTITEIKNQLIERPYLEDLWEKLQSKK